MSQKRISTGFPQAASNRRGQHVQVECYSGYSVNERPICFRLNQKLLTVDEVEDRWYSPSAKYFRVRVGDGDLYILRYDEIKDEWSLDAYCRAELRKSHESFSPRFIKNSVGN